MLLERGDRAGAVVGLLDDEALGAQPVGDGLVDQRLVLDHEDARGGGRRPLGHAASVGPARCGPWEHRVEIV